MADDQNQKLFDTAQGKSSTIDDLVKELSKNNNVNQSRSQSDRGSSMASPSGPPSAGRSEPMASQGPPPNLPGVKIESKPPTPPQPQPVPPLRPLSSPTPMGPFGPVGIQKPSVPPTVSPKSPTSSPMPPKSPVLPPQPPAVPMGTTKPSPVQEYKSSIRTMGEDITSIKSGQKPSGVDIPRKVTPEMPKAPMPGVPKPEMPAPSGPRQVGLGQAEKTGLLPFTPVPKGSETPKSPVVQPPITVPKKKKGFLSPMFYMLIAGALVIGGFLYWFLVLRAPVPEVVLSPTPTPILTPTPLVRNLSNIFEGTPANFEVTLSDDLSRDFKTFVDTLSITAGEFLKVSLVEDIEGALAPLNFMDMLDMDLITYPAALRDNVVDSIVVVYGQSEMFNADGSVNFNAQSQKKAAFVSRVKDRVAVAAMMRDWELTIAEDLAGYLLIADTSKEASVNFLDNTYRGTLIRYKNFPSPDTTVDYAVVEAVGQSYLVIAGSRETMYAAIDALLEQ